MKRHFLVFMAAVCLLSVQNTRGQQMVPAQKISATPAAGTQMTLAQADGIAFRVLSFSEALKRAEVEDKLLFVDCFTTWCGPCKRLSKVVFKDSLVADYFNRHFVNLKMDMEKGEGVELRKKYGVHAYPTLLFINSSGEVVYRLVGAEDAPELLKKVMKLVTVTWLLSADISMRFLLPTVNRRQERWQLISCREESRKCWKMKITFWYSITMCMMLTLPHFSMW